MYRYRTNQHFQAVLALFGAFIFTAFVSFQANAAQFDVVQSLQANYPQWHSQTKLLERESTFPTSNWWQAFGDSQLNAYIEQALAQNQSLAAIQDRVTQARAMARSALGKELPQLSVGAGLTRQKFSQNLVAPSRQQLQGGSIGAFSPGNTLNFYSIPAQASYELDIWQKNRLTSKATKKRVDVAQWTYEGAKTVLSTQVVSAYCNLLKADALKILQQEAIERQQARVDNVALKVKYGVLPADALQAEEQLLQQQRAALEPIILTQQLAANHLSYLTGQLPQPIETLPRGPLEKMVIPSAISVGIPSQLLLRRPDIQSQEAQLQAANFDVRAARREFFPIISLNGELSLSSLSLSNLFQWQSHALAYGGQLVQPLFTGGQRRANLKLNKAKALEQLHLYHDTLFYAFQDVENNLASLKTNYTTLAILQQSENLAQQQVTIQEMKVQQGVLILPDTVPTHLAHILAQQNVIQAKVDVITDMAQLYQSLGGGSSL